jgi:magnesium-transporting ATPase (P-type)
LPCSFINSFCETGIKSPLDTAILQHTQLDVQAYRKLREIPFDFERRRLSVVVDNANGPILMLQVFHASEPLFHTGWFVESLATQTLVLFIIRTAGNPLRSRPSLPLTITVLAIVAFGMLLPFTPLATPLGFTPLPGLYFLFLTAMIVTYLLLVEVVKRWLMRWLLK